MAASDGHTRNMREGKNGPYAVGPVLPPESAQRRPRVVIDLHLRRHQDSSSGTPQPAAEFDVLAAFQMLVEAPDPLEHLPPPARAEDGVHPEKCAGSGPEMRVPDSE